MNDEEPFLKRWSRRKVEAREGPKPGDEPAAAEEAKVAALDSRSERCAVEPEAGPQEKRELTEADFADVDFEALDDNSDYARFLQRRACPRASRTRRCSSCGPRTRVFTTPDPFQDYLHDYTDAAVAVPPGTLKTAYRIGKGFLTRRGGGRVGEARQAAGGDE